MFNLVVFYPTKLIDINVGDSGSPYARTGGVLIVAHWRLSTLTQYLTWFGKSSTSTGDVHIIRDK
jgi:hypothetical protein